MTRINPFKHSYSTPINHDEMKYDSNGQKIQTEAEKLQEEQQKKVKPIRYISDNTAYLYYTLTGVSVTILVVAAYFTFGWDFKNYTFGTSSTIVTLLTLMMPASIFALRMFISRFYANIDQAECDYHHRIRRY